MDRLGRNDSPRKFPASGPDHYCVCRKVREDHAAEHEDLQASILSDALYHKSTLIRMGIQHHDRFLRILTGHTRIKVIHRVIFQLQTFAVLRNRADYILLKSARSKRITDLPKHLYIHTDSSCIFIFNSYLFH